MFSTCPESEPSSSSNASGTRSTTAIGGFGAKAAAFSHAPAHFSTLASAQGFNEGSVEANETSTPVLDALAHALRSGPIGRDAGPWPPAEDCEFRGETTEGACWRATTHAETLAHDILFKGQREKGIARKRRGGKEVEGRAREM